jgi:hypothetical protein
MTLNSLRGEARKGRAGDSGFLEWWVKSKLIDNGFSRLVGEWWVLGTLRRVGQALYLLGRYKNR